MDRAEAMRCLHGLRQSNSVSIAFGQRRLHLKQKQGKSRAWLIPTGLARRLECKLMAGPIGPDGGPPDRAQRNFTDPDSRVLPTRDAFIAGYNGQLAVDAANQIIVAHRLITNSADVSGLIPLVDAASVALGRKPIEIYADNGFASEANLEALAERRIRA
jgi:Transposase DDE domain